MEWGLGFTKGVGLPVALVAVDLAVLQRHGLINGRPHRVQEA